jgi:8-oxo-dGTP pyrophosphatase MutT (NUDIX family)
VRLPDGSLAEREYILHPGAVMIIPLLERAGGALVVLERQYRYPVQRTLVEFPAGKLDPGESALACAQRELREETGYVARQWARAGVLHPVVSYSTEVIEIWFARHLVSVSARSTVSSSKSSAPPRPVAGLVLWRRGDGRQDPGGRAVAAERAGWGVAAGVAGRTRPETIKPMKVLDLQCSAGHLFEGWFASEDDFLDQQARQLVACPLCSDTAVSKMLSAPRLNLGRGSEPPATPDSARPAADGRGDQAAPWPRCRPRPCRRHGCRWCAACWRRPRTWASALPTRRAASTTARPPSAASAARPRPSRPGALLEEGIAVMPLPIPDSLKNTLQ